MSLIKISVLAFVCSAAPLISYCQLQNGPVDLLLVMNPNNKQLSVYRNDVWQLVGSVQANAASEGLYSCGTGYSAIISAPRANLIQIWAGSQLTTLRNLILPGPTKVFFDLSCNNAIVIGSTGIYKVDLSKNEITGQIFHAGSANDENAVLNQEATAILLEESGSIVSIDLGTLQRTVRGPAPIFGSSIAAARTNRFMAVHSPQHLPSK